MRSRMPRTCQAQFIDSHPRSPPNDVKARNTAAGEARTTRCRRSISIPSRVVSNTGAASPTDVDRASLQIVSTLPASSRSSASFTDSS